MRILHTADIHIRGLARHAEYERTFAYLDDVIDEVRPDIVFIGGDIFHTKTQNITPEAVDLMGRWFTSIAERSHLIVTLGNHDANLTNADRCDIVTSVVTLLDDPRITLWRDSGVYECPVDPTGYRWCVFSCVDERGWQAVKPVDGFVNIATFHGAVSSAAVETGFRLEGDVPVEFFDGYDFVLLGDIHKRQVLSERKCVDGEMRPWIAYPGSLIQQNYGEEPTHGVLVWDISSRDDFDVGFVEIPSVNPFVTVEWDGSSDDIDTFITSISGDVAPGSRVRVVAPPDFSKFDWRAIQRRLRDEVGATEVVLKMTQQRGNPTIDRHVDEGGVSPGFDPTNVESYIDALKRYVESRGGSQYLDEMCDALREFASRLDIVDTPTRVWHIDRVSFDNITCYGEGNTIDFTKLKGIIGVFGPNASGKSSLIGSILYALYGTIDRSVPKLVHAVNKRRDYMSASAEIVVDDHTYTIDRMSRRIVLPTGAETTHTTVDFRDRTLDKSLNGPRRNDTDAAITSLIGDVDDFTMTAVATQGQLKSFISQGATARKQLLFRYLNISVFEKLHDMVKTDAAQWSTIIEDCMPYTDDAGWAAAEAQAKGELKRARGVRTSVRRRRRKLEAELADVAEKLKRYDVEKEARRVELEHARELLESKRRTLATITSEIETMERRLDVAKHQVDRIERLLATDKLARLSQIGERFSKLKSTLDEKLRALDDLGREEASIERARGILDVVPCQGAYPTCQFLTDVVKLVERLPEIERARDELRSLVEQLRDEISSFDEDDYTRSVAFVDRMRARLARLRERIDLTADRLSTTYVKRDKLVDGIGELEAKVTSLADEVSSTRSGEYDALNRRSDELRRAIDDLGEVAAELSVTRAKEALESIVAERKKFVKLKRRVEVLTTLKEALGKNGIPKMLLTSMIEPLNAELHRILFGVVDFDVEFSVSDETNNLDVYIVYDDQEPRLVELGSGMERMVASIAIRVALMSVMSLPRPDILIIDEGFSELDDVNISACSSLLQSLSQRFRNVVIITHIPALKDVVDHIVDITWRDGDAYISVE